MTHSSKKHCQILERMKQIKSSINFDHQLRIRHNSQSCFKWRTFSGGLNEHSVISMQFYARTPIYQAIVKLRKMIQQPHTNLTAH